MLNVHGTIFAFLLLHLVVHLALLQDVLDACPMPYSGFLKGERQNLTSPRSTPKCMGPAGMLAPRMVPVGTVCPVSS